MREAKNAWFEGKAEEAEKGRNGGKEVWKSIKEMRRGGRGLAPVRMGVNRNANSVFYSSLEEQQKRWRSHFNNILNITSEFSFEELERFGQRPFIPESDEPPSEEELQHAIDKMENNKAPWSSGILRDAEFILL